MTNRKSIGKPKNHVNQSPTTSMTVAEDRKNTLQLLNVVVAAILISLVLKIRLFTIVNQLNESLPIIDSFFPSLLGQQWTARVAYLLACSGCLLALFSSRKRHLVPSTGLVLANLMVLSIHQSSYNDVTFMCSAWCALWCLWLAVCLGEPFETLFPRAAFLAHLILSLIFFGAAVGKITDGYWSGQVLYDIYFVDRDFWFYNVLRSAFDEQQLREVATWHSRAVIISEFACCVLWMLPVRVASTVAAVILCGIAMTNNFLLFSVVTSLIGLALIGLHQPTARSATGH